MPWNARAAVTSFPRRSLDGCFSEEMNAAPAKELEDEDDFKPGKVVSKRWYIERVLGSGNCGQVYRVRDVSKGYKGAMKREIYNEDKSLNVLSKEAEVLKALAQRKHVPRLLHSARRDQYGYIVMTLLGKNLFDLKRDCKLETLTPACVSRIAIHVLYGLKQLHEVGYIHRDVKPANIVIGRGKESRVVFVIDYGLARKYALWEDGRVRHRTARETALFRGSMRYCSPFVHDRHEQSRRDDLYSVMYSLVFLQTGQLPWSTKKVEAEVKQIKKATTDEVLLEKSPPEWLTAQKHIRSLAYEQRPDYKLLYDAFRNAVQRLKASFRDPYDWESVNKSNRTQSMSQAASFSGRNPDDVTPEKSPANPAGASGKAPSASPASPGTAGKGAGASGKKGATLRKTRTPSERRDDPTQGSELGVERDRERLGDDGVAARPDDMYPTADPNGFTTNDIGI